MKPLTHELARQWMSACHIALLNAIISETRFSCNDIAFQGGTSLHLVRGSPRFSEDLDFLLARNARQALTCSLGRILCGAQESLSRQFPGVLLSFKPTKTSSAGRMDIIDATVGANDYHGKVRVRMEFWLVDHDYLAGYKTAPGSQITMRISDNLPAASIESILADKLLALGNRSFVKWRDIFDIWWITNQWMVESIDIDDLSKRVSFNATAYEVKSLHDGWRRLGTDKDALIARAEQDLSPFLGESLSKKLFPGEIVSMVQRSQSLIAKVIDYEAQTQEHKANKEQRGRRAP